MPKRYHLNRPDLAQAVAVELRTCRDVNSQQRLLAAQLGISRRRFFDWMNALKAGGVAGQLERQHGGGAAPQVPGAALTELLAGLQSGQWKRAKEIQHWLRDRHRIRLKLPGGVLLAGKIGRGLEGAAQDPCAERRGRSRKVPAHALRTVGGLERGWWKAGAPVGGR